MQPQRHPEVDVSQIEWRPETTKPVAHLYTFMLNGVRGVFV